MEKTAFDIGVADGMDKVALSAELIARTAARRGVHPNMLRAIVGAKARPGGLSNIGNIEKSMKRFSDQGLFSRGDIGSKAGGHEQFSNYLRSRHFGS